MPFAPDLSLHPITRQLCDAYLQSGSHAVILHGREGVGLRTIAQAMARRKNNTPDSFMVIQPEDDRDITIEQIRELYSLTKTVRTKQFTVIVDDGDHMGIPAQNAFLKLLEEPPAQVQFIITAHKPHLLLSTIHSRTSNIEVRLISAEITDRLIHSFEPNDIQKQNQVNFLARGLPALAHRLLSNKDFFETQTTYMRSARDFLQASVYERLVYIKPYLGSREDALCFTRALALVLQATIAKQSIQQVTSNLEATATTIDQLEQNSNVRLQLMKLSFSLAI